MNNTNSEVELNDEDNETDELNSKIKQIVFSVITFVIAIIIDKYTNYSNYIMFFIYIIPYLIVGGHVLKEAIEGIRSFEFLDEHFLMSFATISAMMIGFFPDAEPQFIEAVFVMLFFQVGELFEIIAEGKSKKSIKSLLNIRPDYANLVKSDGKVEKVDPHSVKIDDIIVIYPGEKIPLDGIVLEGKSLLNVSAITGESIPRDVIISDMVLSGAINLNGIIKLKVTNTFEESTASKIINLIENANNNKSKSDKFITKFSKIYTPIVVICAILIAIIPFIITGEFITWFYRALTFLVVSCPCALVISVPLAYFGGIGGAAKTGILIKGANYLEAVSKIKTIVFDKTGTLTKGVFEVEAIHPNLYNEKELLHLAAHVESYSSHPIAISLKEAYKKMDNLEDDCEIKEIHELIGLGVKAIVNNDIIYVGNSKLMKSINITHKECHRVGMVVHVAKEDEYLGHIVISDKVKDESKNTIDILKKNGISIYMFTGDTEKIAANVARDLEICNYVAGLLPDEKLKQLENILKLKNKSDEYIAFVGDGINDAPVLARADIGIAMGALGSDAAIESADVVLMDDRISKLIDAIKISKKTQKIVIQNICFALFIKFLVLILAFLGLAEMWMAIFADVGVTILAVFNAMRTLK